MNYPAPAQSARSARAVNDRQSPTVGPGKDFSEKNGRRCLNGRNSETKRDIVMGPKGKMVVMHRVTNALLTKIVLPLQKSVFWPKCAS